MKEENKSLDYVFIDVEKVGCKFILLEKSSIDYYLVTHNSIRLDSIIELKNKYPFIKVLDVQVSGEQVADMAIYTKILELYYTNNENKFTVVSRDKGFERFNKVSNIAIDCLTDKEFQEKLLNTFISMNKEFVDLITKMYEKEKEDISTHYRSIIDKKDKDLNTIRLALEEFTKVVGNLSKETV